MGSHPFSFLFYTQLNFHSPLQPFSASHTILVFSPLLLIKDLPWDTYITALINWLPVRFGDGSLNACQSQMDTCVKARRVGVGGEGLVGIGSPALHHKGANRFPSGPSWRPLSAPTFIKRLTEFHTRCCSFTHTHTPASKCSLEGLLYTHRHRTGTPLHLTLKASLYRSIETING